MVRRFPKISMALRPQPDQINLDGVICKAWEFDYLGATLYIQETGDGDYQVIEETLPRGSWMPVQPERRKQILRVFEVARRRSGP